MSPSKPVLKRVKPKLATFFQRENIVQKWHVKENKKGKSNYFHYNEE